MTQIPPRVRRDRLWYFTQAYYRGSSTDISMFFNKNAGDITKWTYEADPSRGQAQNVGNGPLQPNLRLTIQLSRRDKLNLFWDEQISNNSIGQGSSTSAPETEKATIPSQSRIAATAHAIGDTGAGSTAIDQ